MITLTKEQREAIHQAEPNPPTILDEATNTAYVLVRKEVFDHLRALLLDGPDASAEELRSRLALSVKGNGWDEPEMAAYDRYDEERKRRCQWSVAM